jgi:hypothetical protein
MTYTEDMLIADGVAAPGRPRGMVMLLVGLLAGVAVALTVAWTVPELDVDQAELPAVELLK